MLCKNCGAEYEMHLVKCPYCSAENVEESYRRQKEYVDGYKEKSSFLLHLPNRIVNTTGNIMNKTALYGILFFLLVLLISFIGVKIFTASSTSRMDRQIEKMESYYVEGNYEKLESYYYSVDYLGGAAYEKYYRTVYVYGKLEWLFVCLEELGGDYVEYLSVETVEETLEDTISLLHEIEDMEADGFRYGEGEAMLEFKEQIMDKVETYVPLTEEEFQTAYDRFVEDEDMDYTDEAELILERLLEEK